MLLKDKVAVIYGAAGAIGGATARTFAREGARLFLSGRTLAPVEALAREIIALGGQAEAAPVDALDEEAVEKFAASAVEKAGRIDVSFNAMGFKVVQGVALTDLAREDFAWPVSTWTNAQFLTARAAARRMAPRRAGVILMLSASPARLAVAQTGGFGVACAAVEGLARTFAAELGPQGVRVVCLRSHRIDETLTEPDFAIEPYEFRRMIEDMTLLKRLPKLDELAMSAAFFASNHAAAITGAAANLTCGMDVD